MSEFHWSHLKLKEQNMVSLIHHLGSEATIKNILPLSPYDKYETYKIIDNCHFIHDAVTFEWLFNPVRKVYKLTPRGIYLQKLYSNDQP